MADAGVIVIAARRVGDPAAMALIRDPHDDTLRLPAGRL